MSARRTDSLIAIVQDRTATPSRTLARVTCAKCGSHGDATISGAFNPEASVKRFASLGWDISIHQRSATCPACLETRRNKRAGESPKRVDFNPKEWNAVPMSEQKPRALASAEKANVRRLLDKHFDDATGAYLDGFSDQKIGVEANVPWACVAEMRETAYGPLRVDPALSAAVDASTVLISKLAKQGFENIEKAKAILEATKVIEDEITGALAAFLAKCDELQKGKR